MAETNVKIPELTNEQWALVVELMERERKQLVFETRHTDSRQLRGALAQRMEQVEQILNQIGGQL